MGRHSNRAKHLIEISKKSNRKRKQGRESNESLARSERGAAEVGGIGQEGLKIAKRRNTKRKLAMNKMEDMKTERREKRHKQLAEEERKKTEEGITYEAGGGD